MDQSFVAYTDGACSANGRAGARGAWAYVLTDVTETKQLAEGFAPSGIDGATNNQMEVCAVLEALKRVSELYGEGQKVTIKTDSKLVIGWMAQGWKRNNEALRPILAAADLELAKHEVSFVWVKGHNGNALNELVDQLAVKAAAS